MGFFHKFRVAIIMQLNMSNLERVNEENVMVCT